MGKHAMMAHVHHVTKMTAPHATMTTISNHAPMPTWAPKVV
jgi:hypothetical protein